MASAQDLQPTCEDYESEQSDGHVLDTFHGRKSPNAANVSTKRSHPSDLDKEKPPAQERVPHNVDIRSDSGYSSYTAATVSSTNSAPSAPSQRSPPVAPATTFPVPASNPPPKPRRPTLSEQRQNSANTSPRPAPLSRRASQSSRTSTQRRPTVTQERLERKDRRNSRAAFDEVECTDPTCTKCGPNALSQRLRHPLQPSQSARDVSHPPADQRSMRSDPAAYHTSPPSPTYTRQSAYMNGPTIVQPAERRRRPSSTAPRPMSYSGEPGPQYWSGSYPSPPQDHGPPPSTSAAWHRMPHYQMPSVGQMGHPMHTAYMTPQAQAPYYPPYHHNQTSPPYEGQSQRPGMPSRNSSHFGTRNGPAPIITQAAREPTKPSARYGQPPSATQPRFPRPLQLQAEAYEFESESATEDDEYDDDDYEPEPLQPRPPRALMPPPQLIPTKSKSKKQRPPMRHANTTQVSDVDHVSRRMSQSLVVDERPGRERAAKNTNEPLRRKSVSRPAARHTQSEYASPLAQTTVARSERRRPTPVYEAKTYDHTAQAREYQERMRVQGEALSRVAEAKAREEAKVRAHKVAKQQKAFEDQYQAEQTRERKRQSRNSKVHYQQPPELFDDDSEVEESDEEIDFPQAPVPPRRRRPTDVESHKGKGRVSEPKTRKTEDAAEDYISALRGAQKPFADEVHSIAKRAPRVPSQPSRSGSSRSAGSDQQSQSNRTAVTSNGGNEIRLRVDASAPLSLQFNGDMDGRTFRMVPAENGMADIVIGGGSQAESVYNGSHRGSVAGDRKALVAPRRYAEDEVTERSVRSSRSKREDREVRDSWDDREGQRRRRRASTINYPN